MKNVLIFLQKSAQKVVINSQATLREKSDGKFHQCRIILGMGDTQISQLRNAGSEGGWPCRGGEFAHQG